MSTQIRKLTQAGADYWNLWADTKVDAGQEVEHNVDDEYNTSCNGESWAVDIHYFEPLNNTQEQQ
jgi:hypothetical protein